jgi:hypothetical protein
MHYPIRQRLKSGESPVSPHVPLYNLVDSYRHMILLR